MLEELLRRLNAGELRFADPANAPMKEEVRAVLGEVYYRLGKNDMAVEAMEACLASDKLDLSFKTRARWVLAEVFLKEGHATEALPYAARCFMLASDDVYSPRGMHATIRAFLKLGKEENALNTWEDLKTRYPAYAEQVRGDPRIAAVVAKEKKTSETGEKQEPPADAGQ
jgi:tetratricopeptide (TPR) repeat protein